MLQKHLKLIGYVRLGDSLVSGIEQLNAIKSFCRANKHQCVTVCTDTDRPAFGLSRALQLLKNCDGLITYDTTRLAENQADTYRELRPLIETYFMHGHKKFITVSEGFETITPAGQENLMTVLNEWHRNNEIPIPTYDAATHEIYLANQM